MANDNAQRMEALRMSTAGIILATYLRGRLTLKQELFVKLPKDAFEVHKGRCLELEDLIKFIEGKGT